MKQKRLILHIGLHKTGTSAIQRFLFENAEALSEQGFLYPVGLFNSIDHNPIAWCMVPSRYFPPDYPFYWDHAKKNYWAHLHEIVETSRAHTAILSGEDFSLIDQVHSLAQECAAYDTRIVVYLRRQDDLIWSLYNQMVKGLEFRLTWSFEEFLSKHWLSDILSFDRFLNEWSEAFGRNALTVSTYEAQVREEAFLQEFCNICGIPAMGGLSFPKERVNRSLHPSVLEAKRFLNAVSWRREEHDLLLTVLYSVSDQISRSGRSPLQPYNIQSRLSRWMGQYEEGNRNVARTFFHRDELFPKSQAGPKPVESSSMQGACLEELHKVFVMITERLVRYHTSLRRTVTST